MSRVAKNIIISLGCLIFASACETPRYEDYSPPLAKAPSVKQQIENSTAPAFMDSEYCIPWSGNLAQDRAETTAAAKGQLMLLIRDKAKLMDAAISETSTDPAFLADPFTSVASDTAKNTILPSRSTRVDVVKKPEGEEFCAQTKIDPEAAEDIFEELLFRSGLSLTDEQKEKMSQVFFTIE